jgi:RNA-directed DNA polymerase
VNFSPGVSREALKTMRQTVRGWHLQLMGDKELSDLSKMFGPVLRGWSNYYGRFYPSAMHPYVEARERLSGALDAAKVQTPCSRGDSRSTCAWPSCGTQAEGVRALGEGSFSYGSMMGAG